MIPLTVDLPLLKPLTGQEGGVRGRGGWSAQGSRHGLEFLRTLQIQGQGKLGMASIIPEGKIDLYIWPMGAGGQGSSLVSSSVLPAPPVASEAPLPTPKPRQHVASSWPEVLCKVMVVAH